MEQALTVRSSQPVTAFSSADAFENVQRMAKLLGESGLVPEAYRRNVPDCVIALEIASRIGASPLAVMQNLYIVHGKPAWSSQFLIACVNASGRFTPLRYKFDGEKNEDSWSCRAWAKDATGEVLFGPEVSIAMAKAEGWVTKNGSKWRTMPELMLTYRAATLFARTYAPELTMGIHTDEEVIDVASVVTEAEPKVSKPLFKPKAEVTVEPAAPPSPAPAPNQFVTACEGLLQVTGATVDDVFEFIRESLKVATNSWATLADADFDTQAKCLKKITPLRSWLQAAADNRAKGKS